VHHYVSEVGDSAPLGQQLGYTAGRGGVSH
jgi:hypothetical protein